MTRIQTDTLTDPHPRTDPLPLLPVALALPAVYRSASYAAPWTRALEAGLRRHGPTPTYDAVAADLGYHPTLLPPQS